MIVIVVVLFDRMETEPFGNDPWIDGMHRHKWWIKQSTCPTLNVNKQQRWIDKLFVIWCIFMQVVNVSRLFLELNFVLNWTIPFLLSLCMCVFSTQFTNFSGSLYLFLSFRAFPRFINFLYRWIILTNNPPWRQKFKLMQLHSK